MTTVDTPTTVASFPVLPDARDTIQALLSHGELPARMGLNEHFWPFIIENAWGEQGIAPKTDLARHFGMDIACAHWCNLPGPRPDLATTLEANDEWEVKRGAWGDISKYWTQRAGTPEHMGFTVESPEAWYHDFRDAFLAQDPLAEIDMDQIRGNVERLRGQGRFVTYSFMFVFEWLRRVFGDVFMLESLLLEPELIHDFNRCITDRFLTIYEAIFREVGLPDGIHFYEDLGYTQAAFASPTCHREMVLPYHVELLGFFKARGLPVIMHTCGDFRPHLPAIVEAGVDCIQALEAKTGMHVGELAKDWGDRLCFMGNLDVRPFESGDRQAIADEVLGKITAMRKQRAPYIIMSDHSIPPSVRVDDYVFALELMRDHCRYETLPA